MTGKHPKLLKDEMTEWRNGGESPQILKDGMTEVGNEIIPFFPAILNRRRGKILFFDVRFSHHYSNRYSTN